MSDKQLIQEKSLWKRLVISQNDLIHAQWYVNLILSKKLHHSKIEEDKYLHRGLNTALLISYWRPFSKNKDTVIRLPEKYLKEFTLEEKNFHDQIGKLRNQEVAHSDAISHNVKINVANFAGTPLAIPISRNAYIPLEKPQTEMLRSMIKKMLQCIEGERIRIERQLSIGDNF